jgi:hypothetical protein
LLTIIDERTIVEERYEDRVETQIEQVGKGAERPFSKLYIIKPGAPAGSLMAQSERLKIEFEIIES